MYSFYILESNDGKNFKIGIAGNCGYRHKVLFDATPFGFSCIRIYKFETITQAKALESAIKLRLVGYRSFTDYHQKFDGYTEWFTINTFTRKFMGSIVTGLKGRCVFDKPRSHLLSDFHIKLRA